ncbi:MAG: 4Fe-4S binding protein [Clostridiales bacterium]|nr:4Fe-4S binding protein [Clostridiales bacterium]
MPLFTGGHINDSKCGACDLCVRHCPGKAVQGDNWRVGIDRDALLDAFAC